MEQENQKKHLVFKIIAFEPGSTNSHIVEEDTSHWQSICYQATLKCKITQREKFSKPSSLRVMKKIMKVFSWAFYKFLGPFNLLTVKGCFETAFFRE